MSESTSAFYVRSMQERAAAISDACTTCGACFEACPMTGPAGLGAADPREVTGGILDMLGGGTGTASAQRWAGVCNASGACVDSCPEDINPRFMVQLARGMLRRGAGEAVARANGQKAYAGMARLARVISRLEVPPEVTAKLMPPKPETPRATPPEVVFYTGCNVPKTPHIVLLVLDILDKLGVDYEVTGGTGNCCGIYQFRAGDFGATGRMAASTIETLAAHGTPTVLSWCPSCQVQFFEVTLPSYAARTGAMPFEMAPILRYLATRADDLRAMMVNRVEKRVALHERPAVKGAMAAVRTLLATVPGLELVEIDVPRVGTGLNSLAQVPEFKRAVLAEEFAKVAEAGVETLATVYHSCHRELCTVTEGMTFEVLNFLELIGAGLGIVREDLYRRIKMLDDVDAMIADTMPMITAHGIDIGTAREALMAEFFP